MLTFKMDASDFRKRGKEMVDYIADYMETISNRRVTPDVEPGYLAEKLPKKAPKKGEEFNDIMIDVDKYIIPGITHWQHPHFHAFFPAGNSFPSILGDMLSDAIGCVGFSWVASPACTELEIVVLDWFGKMLGLPNEFLHEGGTGGGVIQGSASECVLVTLLAARHTTLKDLKGRFPFVDDGILLPKLVAYSSKLAHSCVEKAGMIGLVKMRQLDVDEHFSLRGHVLERAIEEDRRLGLIPFYVCATLGTTACCSFDHLQELSEVCAKESVWLHVDAAYAGNALICAENQHYIRGIENATSFNCNPNKWMLVNFDCSLMWVRNKELLTSSMAVDPLYLQHKHDVALSGQITRMYTTLQIRFQLKGKRYYYIFPALGWPFVYPRQVKEVKLVALLLNHWGIPLSRRFRSLKIWFVIRTYGVEGLQHYIRKHIRLAKLFETYVKNDARFEVMGKVTMGLVCFRLKGPNSLTQKLCRMINESARLYTVPALINENYVIRFCVCAQDAMESDIEYAWRIISQEASELLDQRASIESNIEAEKNDRPEEVENNGEFDDVFPDFDDEIIFDQQRSNLQRARIRRNLFMRMVSDPKCYNPKVLRALNTDKPRHKSESDGEK